jgi:hypothetical protein
MDAADDCAGLARIEESMSDRSATARPSAGFAPREVPPGRRRGTSTAWPPHCSDPTRARFLLPPVPGLRRVAPSPQRPRRPRASRRRRRGAWSVARARDPSRCVLLRDGGDRSLAVVGGGIDRAGGEARASRHLSSLCRRRRRHRVAHRDRADDHRANEFWERRNSWTDAADLDRLTLASFNLMPNRAQ